MILTPSGARDGPTNLESEVVEDYDTDPEPWDDYRIIDLGNFCRRINE